MNLSTQQADIDQKRSDVWSIGVLVFYMLTGTLPFAPDLSALSEEEKDEEYEDEVDEDDGYYDEYDVESDPYYAAEVEANIIAYVSGEYALPELPIEVSENAKDLLLKVRQ